MALVVKTLEIALKGIFAAMQDGSKTDAWMAAQVADAITTYILTAQAVTVDTGAAPGGAYAGAGVGVMAINNSNLAGKLKTTFEAAYENAVLATRIADDIHAVCTAKDSIKSATAGTVTTPLGVSVPFAGMGKGTFTGVKTTIEAALQACFTVMNTMMHGGDDYLAAQWAASVDAYLKAGMAQVTLQAPLTGTGAGALV